jgi:hypothetical protein
MTFGCNKSWVRIHNGTPLAVLARCAGCVHLSDQAYEILVSKMRRSGTPKDYFRLAVLNRPMSLNGMSEVRSGVFLDSE